MFPFSITLHKFIHRKMESMQALKNENENKNRYIQRKDGHRKPHPSYLAGASASTKSLSDPQKSGLDYVHCLLMLFKCRGEAFGYKFKLGTEIEDAMKFSDVIFFYTKDDKKYYRCLQSIHTTVKKKTIDLNKLITHANSDFSLVKYFFSYIDMKQKDLFKNLINKDVIVYTNIPLNLDSIIGPKMVSEKTWEMLNLKKGDYKKKLKDLVEVVVEPDDILDVMEDKCQYRFNEIIVPTLKMKINDFNMTRVSLSLIKWFEKKQIQPIEYIVKPYWGFLIKNVIDVDNKMLYDEFLNGTVNTEVKMFRNIFISTLVKKDLTIEEINAMIPDIMFFPDWKTSHDIDLNNVIVDDCIKDFLKQFVLATNQPSCEELYAMIKKEFTDRKRKIFEEHNQEIIRKVFGNVLNDICKEIFKINTDTDTESEEEEEEKIKEDLGSSLYTYIQFDLRKPNRFFVGRETEMKDLHNKINHIQTNQNDTQMKIISGPSGIGKTEMVRAYIQKYGLSHFDKNVIWINGHSWSSIERCFNRLAIDELMISPINDSGTVKSIERLMDEVYEMLRNRKCLIVIDGATSQDDVEKYMPKKKLTPNQPFFLITAINLTWKMRQSNETSGEEMIRFISRILRGMEVPD